MFLKQSKGGVPHPKNGLTENLGGVLVGKGFYAMMEYSDVVYLALKPSNGSLGYSRYSQAGDNY